MKPDRRILFFALTVAFSSPLGALSPPPYPFETFDFSPLLHTEITEFTVTDRVFVQDYEATFSGGLVKENPDTTEAGDVHWVVLPAGNTTQGNSTGEATITLKPLASYVLVTLTAGMDVQGRIQLLDDRSGLISETAFSGGEQVDVTWSQAAGEPLLSKFLLIVDGGTAEVGVTRFLYADPIYFENRNDLGDDSYGGSLAPMTLSILIVLNLLMFYRRYKIPN